MVDKFYKFSNPNMNRAVAAALGAVLVAAGSAAFMAIQQQEKRNSDDKERLTRRNQGELEEEEPQFPEGFREAVQRVKGLNVEDTQTQLKLYGLFKRVTVGLPNEKDKPWEPFARAKWNAWNDCRDLSKEEACLLYIALVNQLDNSAPSASTTTKKQLLGPKVSKMANNTDPTVDSHSDFEGAKYYDEARNDFSMLSQLLDEHPTLIRSRDENDLTLLHWAVDGDNLEAAFTLERGANIDAKDVDGFTPLGYAASSGLTDLALFLMTAGANVKEASPGKAAWELTRDEELKRKLMDGLK
jgi:acyl-CoA-binding protein